MKIKKFNEMNTFNISFKNEEEFIKFWSERWKGTISEKFPNEFLMHFPSIGDYSEFEKSSNSKFDPQDEVDNIESEFGILIGEDITTDDWLDFYNSCWTWKKKK